MWIQVVAKKKGAGFDADIAGFIYSKRAVGMQFKEMYLREREGKVSSSGEVRNVQYSSKRERGNEAS